MEVSGGKMKDFPNMCRSYVIGGKSNVIDALLFVFGKRATQVRLKKISELIHNSEHHLNIQKAKVTVRFVEIVDTQDDDDYQVIPGTFS